MIIALKRILRILCIFYCQTTQILKTLGQFENLVFVIMSTRENIRLIVRATSYNRVSHLTRDTIWESDKKMSHTRGKPLPSR